MCSTRVVVAPDEASLHEAALAYLARYSATEAGLRRVLDRRIDRWARGREYSNDNEQVQAARLAVRTVVARLAAAGVVNNAAFAEARSRSLRRAGRSRRAVAAHLAAKGVDPETVRAALPEDPADELAAAVGLIARRRLGPFRTAPTDDTTRHRELGALARAGFPRNIAVRALDLDRDAAEAILHRLRQE